MRLLVSATDNCAGDTKSREVLVTSTPQATKHSPLPSATFSAEDQKCTMTGLPQNKQERWRALLESQVPAPAGALLGRSAQGKGRMNCAGLLLLWDLAEVHPTDSSWVCSPLSRGRSVRASKQVPLEREEGKHFQTIWLLFYGLTARQMLGVAFWLLVF